MLRVCARRPLSTSAASAVAARVAARARTAAAAAAAAKDGWQGAADRVDHRTGPALRATPAVAKVLPPFVERHAGPAAAAPAGDVPGAPGSFAVVEIDGGQHRVTEGCAVMVDRQKHYEVGETVAIERVLLVGTAGSTVIGRPTVPGAAVRAVVEEHLHTAKVLSYKKRRRKGSSKDYHGHRAQVSVLKVLAIDAPAAEAATS